MNFNLSRFRHNTFFADLIGHANAGLYDVEHIAALILLACADHAPEYSVRGQYAPTGTSIPLSASITGGIPINRQYDEFADDERQSLKELVRQWNKEMRPDDEPPFPINGLKPLLQSVQQIQEEMRWDGHLTLVATVNADGKVANVVQYGLSPTKLSGAVASALRRTKFKPAKCGGAPCTMNFPFAVNFELKRDPGVTSYRSGRFP